MFRLHPLGLAMSLTAAGLAIGWGADLVPFPTGQFGGDTGIGDTGFVEHDVGQGLLEPGEYLTYGVTGPNGTAFGYQQPFWNAHGDSRTLLGPWSTPNFYGAELFYSVWVDGVLWPTYDYPKLMETCESLRENNLVVFSDNASPLTYEAFISLEHVSAKDKLRGTSRSASTTPSPACPRRRCSTTCPPASMCFD